MPWSMLASVTSPERYDSPCGNSRRLEQVVVRHVGEQAAVQHRVVGTLVDEPEPEVPHAGARATRLHGLTERNSNGRSSDQKRRRSAGMLSRWRRTSQVMSANCSGCVTTGAGHLVVGAVLLHLEGRRHVEDLLAVLDRHHAAAGEALAVAAAVHFVDDRRVEVAAAPGSTRASECTSRPSTVLHAAFSAWPSTWPPNTCGLPMSRLSAAKQVLLEPLEVEQPDQVPPAACSSRRAACRSAVHRPSRFCMMGLVVVYCRCTFLAGLRCSAIAKAASAASWKPLRMSFFFPG